ncbi:MAG: tyrosine-type recombinase/integrase [Rhodoferax sp.]
MKGMRVRPQKSGKTYYYFDTGTQEVPLGSDYIIAVQKWVELAQDKTKVVVTFKDLADKYAQEELPLKAKSTQATQRGDIKMLREFFGTPVDAPINQIKPKHIWALLEWKKSTPTTANRLKRVFSHMFNKARQWGYTERENPVRGIEGFALGKREVDVSEAVYKAVWNVASEPLRDAMDLAYLTGQRPGDVLQFNERQIVDGVFIIKKQSKTGTPLRIRVEGEFGQLLERIAQRKSKYKVWCTSLTVNLQGLALTKHTLRNHFEPARAAAAAANPALAEEIKAMWFYDLRAKAADDTADDHGDQAAADLLGHKNVATTQRHYLRRGKKVGPTR